MLTHDQNEVKTDLSEQELLEGIDKTSQTNEEEQVPTE